jgi:hypothetical protein
MALAALGIAGATTATGMAGMDQAAPASPGVLATLLQIGPWLLGISVLLVTVSFALGPRRWAAIPALLAGAVLYAGMYTQTNLVVMYASIAIGYIAWLALYLWSRGVSPTRAHRGRD